MSIIRIELWNGPPTIYQLTPTTHLIPLTVYQLSHTKKCIPKMGLLRNRFPPPPKKKAWSIFSVWNKFCFLSLWNFHSSYSSPSFSSFSSSSSFQLVCLVYSMFICFIICITDFLFNFTTNLIRALLANC